MTDRKKTRLIPRWIACWLCLLILAALVGCKSGDDVSGTSTSFAFATSDMSGIWAFTWNGATISNIRFTPGGDITWTDDTNIVSGVMTIRSTANIDGRFVLAPGVMSLDGTIAADKKSISGTFTTNPGGIQGTWTASRASNTLLMEDRFSGSALDALVWQQLLPGGGNTPYVSGGALRIMTDGVTNGDTGVIAANTVSAGGNFRVQVDVNAAGCTEDCTLSLKIYNKADPSEATTTTGSDTATTDTTATTDSGDTTGTVDACASYAGLYNDFVALSLEMTNVYGNTMSGAFSASQTTGCATTSEAARIISTKNSGTLTIDFADNTFTLSFTESGGSQQTLASYSTDEWILPAGGMNFLVALTGTSADPSGSGNGYAQSGAGFFFDNLFLFLL